MRRRRSTLGFIIAVGALSLLASSCGGTSPGVANVATPAVPNTSSSPATASRTAAVVVAGRCLRDHGLTNLPDPTIATSGPAKGGAYIDKQALRAFPDALVTHAMAACETDLQKAGIGGGSSARTPQEIQDGLAFAGCVRRHGISNFPDPNGQGSFDLAGSGINSHELTPAQLAAARACLSVAHGTINIPQQVTNAGSSGQ